MKLNTTPSARRSGFALLLVLILVAVFIVILAASMNRSNTVAVLNQRNNDYNTCASAAEGAVEKVYARMASDFMLYRGPGQVNINLTAGVYQTNIPTAAEDSYWTNFQFSDGQGHVGKTFITNSSTYSGPLPSAYPGLTTTNAPVYRIVSNVKLSKSRYNVVATAQEDLLLALVPLTTWAIFYNGLLEFSDCAPMVVNGRVQANGPIYVGTITSSSLTFNGMVNSTATITAPYTDGFTSSSSGVWTPSNSAKWQTTFNAGSAAYGPSVTTSLVMTNSHILIDLPASAQTGPSYANNYTNSQMLYNQAQMVLLVTNTPGKTNPTVQLILQASYNQQVPGADSTAVALTYTNVTQTSLNTNLPFLSETNIAYDLRETDTNIITQIDMGKLATWVSSNSIVQGKLPASSGVYPTILYVADRRTRTSSQLPSVRLVNGTKLPANGGLGFSVATPNPLYVQGNYNVTTSAGTSTGTNNAYEVPAALFSDALTILSANWNDSRSLGKTYSSSDSTYNATDTTINAAIVTGNVVSTGTSATTFSGGVHNLPRLLEDWATTTGTSAKLFLNTSILCLWQSQIATNQFVNPGTYYNAPNRYYTFDQNFLNPNKVPPGIPVALVPIRFNWCVPPPNTVTYDTGHN
jgi:hypothetical protein